MLTPPQHNIFFQSSSLDQKDHEIRRLMGSKKIICRIVEWIISKRISLLPYQNVLIFESSFLRNQLIDDPRKHSQEIFPKTNVLILSFEETYLFALFSIFISLLSAATSKHAKLPYREGDHELF